MVCTVSQAADADYYITAQSNFRSSADYYTVGTEAPGHWWNVSGVFGLKDGEVIDSVAFKQMYHGFSPDGEYKLVRNAGAENRSKGLDMTFSADKSVSALWAVADADLREKIADCHNAAVRRALNEFINEHAAFTRAGRGGSNVHKADLIGAFFQHSDSREGDPQLHTHAVILNVSRDHEDQKFRAVHQKPLYRWGKAAGAAYRASLAWKLQTELGIKVEQHGKDLELIRIIGVDDELKQYWSKRRGQILQAAKALGFTPNGDGARMAPINLFTRSAKKAGSEGAELRHAKWQKEAEQFVDISEMVDRTVGVDAARSEEELKKVRQELGRIPRQLTQLEAVFRYQDVVRRVCEVTAGSYDVEFAKDAVKKIFEHQSVIKLDLNDAGPDGENRLKHASTYSTKRELNEEADIRAFAARLRIRGNFNVTRARAAELLVEHSKRALTNEQIDAYNHAVSDSGGIAIVEGSAGAGKSAVLAPIAAAYKAEGYKVIGTAVAWRQANALASDCGIRPYSVDKLLAKIAHRRISLDEKTVVIVDEAFFKSVRQTHRLLRAIEDSGAKVILSGDSVQQQPIEQGAGARLARDEVGSVRIDQMRRQLPDLEDVIAHVNGVDRETARVMMHSYSPEQRSALLEQHRGNFTGSVWQLEAATDFKEGRALPAIEAYAQRGRLHFLENQDDLYDKVVADWVQSRADNPNQSSIVIARTNHEVAELNGRMREIVVGNSDQTFQAVVDTTKGDGECRVSKRLHIAKGDVLKVGATMEDKRLHNGDVVTVNDVRLVESDGRSRVLLDVTTTEGRDVQFYADDCRDYYSNVRLDYGYAVTFAAAQGVTVDNAFALVDEKPARETIYPVATRHREAMHMYANRSLLSMLVYERLPEDQQGKRIENAEIHKYLGSVWSRSQAKENALDFMHEHNVKGLVDAALKRAETREYNRTHLPDVAYEQFIAESGKTPKIDGEVLAKVDRAVSNLTRFKSVFSKEDAVMWFGMNGVSSDKLELHFYALANDDRVVGLYGRDETQRNPLFSTVATMAEERQLVENLDSLSETARHVHYDVRKVGVTAGLDAERHAVIRDVFGARGLSVVRVRPGSVRANTLEGIRSAGRAKGAHMYGVAPMAAGLDAFGGKKQNVQTINGFINRIKSGKSMVGRNSFVVVNDAEKVNNNTMLLLTELAKERGFKLVLVGDETEFQGYGRNGVFRFAADRFNASMPNNESHHYEANPVLRALRSGSTADAVAELNRAGHVHFGDDENATVSQIADRWIDSELRKGSDDQLVLVASASQKDAMASLIQKARLDAGVLGEGVEIRVETGGRADMSDFERFYLPADAAEGKVNVRMQTVHVGDRIRFRADDTKIGVRNGMVGEVLALRDRHLIVRTQNNDVVRFTPEQFNKIELAYAAMPHQVTDRRYDHIHAPYSPMWTDTTARTIMSRHEQSLAMYVEAKHAPDIDVLIERFNDHHQREMSAAYVTRSDALDGDLGTASLNELRRRWSGLSSESLDRLSAADERREAAIFEHQEDIKAVAGGRKPFARVANDSAVYQRAASGLRSLREYFGKGPSHTVERFKADMDNLNKETRAVANWAKKNHETPYAHPDARRLVLRGHALSVRAKAIETNLDAYRDALTSAGMKPEELQKIRRQAHASANNYRSYQVTAQQQRLAEVRTFTTDYKDLVRRRLAMQPRTQDELVQMRRSAAYHDWLQDADRVAAQGTKFKDNYGTYQKVLSEIGITEPKMVDQRLSQLKTVRDGDHQNALRVLSKSNDPVLAYKAVQQLHDIAERGGQHDEARRLNRDLDNRAVDLHHIDRLKEVDPGRNQKLDQEQEQNRKQQGSYEQSQSHKKDYNQSHGFSF